MQGKRKLRRGLYLLPTCFTTGNLFCGFYSVIESLRGSFGDAAMLIIVAGILDALDGWIARLTGTTSDFGVEYDSLADVVSFGVAPAVMAYGWGLTPFGRLGWLTAFLFVACAAARLARFNIQSSSQDKRFFAGLPSPAAAGTPAAIVFAFPSPPQDPVVGVLVAALVVLVAILMISRVRYRAFKKFDVRNRRSYVWVLPIAAVLAVVISEPRYTFMAMAAVYVTSGPIGAVLGLFSKSKETAASADRVPERGEVVHDPAAR